MASPAVDFIRRHKRPLTGTLVGILVAVVAMTVPRLVFATFQDTLLGILSGITYWLISLLANLLVVVINIMVAAAQYSKFLGVEPVEKGWAIVRDVCNMFFIVVLLIIAFGTILRLENYRYNRLLARLIVMAILVNFSKFIAGFFIDFSQVIMLTFVNAWRDVAAGNFTQALGLSDIIALSNNQQSLSVDVSSGAVFSALILGLAVVLIAVIVMVIITIVLIIRILALWFLIVLSPLAYLLKTYPSTEKYAARWWQEFGKYTVTGPVVAFLLWLSLAIMSGPVSHDILATKTTTGETSSVIQGDVGGTSPAERISATISAIGQSDKLLSYMIGIMLLVGTLVITKELGVAGGQMAGQAASRIQGFATKAATLAGAGIATGGLLAPAAMATGRRGVEFAKSAIKAPAKGIGGGIRNWLEGGKYSPLKGMVLSPKEWMEQIHEVGKEHRDEAIVRRNAVSSQRIQGAIRKVPEKRWSWSQLRRVETGKMVEKQFRARPVLGSLGQPGNFPKYKLRLLQGRAFDEASMSAHKEREKLSLAERRVALRGQAKDLAKFGAEELAGDSVKRKKDARIAAIAAARVTNPSGHENRKIEGWNDDGTVKYGKETFEEWIATRVKERGGRAFTSEEMTKLNEDWNTDHAEKELMQGERRARVDERLKHVQVDANPDGTLKADSRYGFGREGATYNGELKKKIEAVPILTDKGFDEDVERRLKKAKAGTTRDTIEKTVQAEADKKRKEVVEKHQDDWAHESLAGEEEYEDPLLGLQRREQEKIEADPAMTKAVLEAEGASRITTREKELKEDIERAERGELTSKQRKEKEAERGSLAGDIAALKDGLSPAKIVSLSQETIEEMKRKLASKEEAHNEVTAVLKSGVGNEKDREAAKKEVDELRATKETLQAMRQTPASEGEMRTLEEAAKTQREIVQKAEKAVAAVRPPVPYEQQRELRDSINDKKKQVQSDSWHEHAAVFEDAIKRHDAALAAAALTRATEYGNENELMNFFGYDYTPEDFQAFIKDMFIDKMHLSESQALAVATDVSYIAEKNRHWNIARTTHVDAGTGRLGWQPNANQQVEVEAEVGKLDFEDFMRRGNRLAWGSEFIGGEGMRGATREEKAEYFRSGGGREFQMAPYAQAILADNYGKMMRNMGQARYNVNLSMKLNSNMNKPILDKLERMLTGVKQLSEGKEKSFTDWRKLNDQFSAFGLERGDDFRMLRRILSGEGRR